MDGEFGFAPANYIEITGKTEQKSPPLAMSPETSGRGVEPEQTPSPVSPVSPARAGPAAALAGIMHRKSPSTDSAPASSAILPSRRPQFTPEDSEEDTAVPSLPQRPPSQQLSPPTQYATARSPESPGVAASPPYNRAVSQNYDEDRAHVNNGGFHLYSVNEVVSAMGRNNKLPTVLGLNVATGVIMIAPEKSRDGPQQDWTAEKLTHYSIEGKHVFMELVRPSKSIDFHAGAKDTAQEIVAALGDIAGASRGEGLREVIEAASGGPGRKKGKILYDFMAQGDDEVTVAADDEVVVIDDTKSEEWWMVKRMKNGKEGVVPSSYVEITGFVPPPRSSSGLNAAKSIVEQNRLEEERLAKEAAQSSKGQNGGDKKGSEVGPGLKLPERGSSIARGDYNNHTSQRSKKDSKHGKSSSTSKSSEYMYNSEAHLLITETEPNMSKTRTWTDRSGSFKVEAEFIGLKDGKIHLHKLNGVKIAVPVGKMAVEDLEFVERITGQSLDDEKPLSDIRRRSTQSVKEGDRRKVQAAPVPRSGATVEQAKPPKPEGQEYDWFDFFLKAGVSPYQCERYAFNFSKDSMDENVLADISAPVLRTLGLKEGDILRVMKYLDTKFGRTGRLRMTLRQNFDGAKADMTEGATSPDNAGGGLFSGPGGALRNNTRKGRPAAPVQSDDVVDANMLKSKDAREEKAKERTETPLAQAPAPPKKDANGFDDNAWDIKPSKQPAQQLSQKPVGAPPAMNIAPPQQTLSSSLLDLSLLSPPLQPTPAQNTSVQQPQQMQNSQSPPPAASQQAMQQQSMQQQPTGANPSFFSQLGSQPTGAQLPQQNPSQQSFSIQQQNQQNQQTFQNQLQPQQTAAPRQRPQAPQQIQSGPLVPPPPARPLSAPQTQPQNSNFGPPPLQPQLTGYQLQTHLQPQVAAPGQSLNDLNQQRLQQQQIGQQQQFQQQQFGQQLQTQPPGFGHQLQQQPTGFAQPNPPFTQFNNGIVPQQTGFGQQFPQQPGLQNMQNPYVNGQQAGSPFADPRTQQQTGGFQPLQPQSTGYQPQFQLSLQPQQTGINSVLSPALQPQQTGVNGFSRPSFGQPPPPMPPMPPMPQQQPAAAPLLPQKTGPAPPVRFGTTPNKLVPQKTGRANLAAASKLNSSFYHLCKG